MPFYHKITCIFVIYVLSLQNFAIAIYAHFPPYFGLKSKLCHFFTFRMYDVDPVNYSQRRKGQSQTAKLK